MIVSDLKLDDHTLRTCSQQVSRRHVCPCVREIRCVSVAVSLGFAG